MDTTTTTSTTTFAIRPNIHSAFPFEVWKVDHDAATWVINAAFLTRREAAAWIGLNEALDQLARS